MTRKYTFSLPDSATLNGLITAVERGINQDANMLTERAVDINGRNYLSITENSRGIKKLASLDKSTSVIFTVTGNTVTVEVNEIPMYTIAPFVAMLPPSPLKIGYNTYKYAILCKAVEKNANIYVSCHTYH